MPISPAERRFLGEFASANLLFVLVLIASPSLREVLPAASPWRWAVALLPVLPALLVAWSWRRHVGRMDELQRRVQLEALSFAFAGTVLVAFGYGLLEGEGLPRLPMSTVWGVMALLLTVGQLRAGWRYQ